LGKGTADVVDLPPDLDGVAPTVVEEIGRWPHR
jgi:hypothetical protein